MKVFEIPEVQIVKFENEIITSSGCVCNRPNCISYCESQVTCPGKCYPHD